jgi:hypothetical protein
LENLQIYDILRLELRNRGGDQKTDFFTLTSNIYQIISWIIRKKLIDLSEELFLIILINKPQTK